MKFPIFLSQSFNLLPFPSPNPPDLNDSQIDWIVLVLIFSNLIIKSRKTGGRKLLIFSTSVRFLRLISKGASGSEKFEVCAFSPWPWLNKTTANKNIIIIKILCRTILGSATKLYTFIFNRQTRPRLGNTMNMSHNLVVKIIKDNSKD